MNISLVSLNIGLLAVFYTLIGGLVSFVIYYLFEDHSDDWEKKRPLWYQLLDVVLELTFVGLVGFWFTYNIKEYPPLVPMSRSMDALVDTYVSAIFFGYSMFIFLDDLTKKIKHLYNVALKNSFERILPNGILIYLLRKTDL